MLVSVNNLRKAFGVDEILTKVSFTIDRREKVALVGRNGTGKTTLLRILTGQYAPDNGSIHLSKGAKIGYLKQESAVEGGRTVLQEAQAAYRNLLDLRERLAVLEAKLETASPDEIEEYSLLHEHFSETADINPEVEIRQILLQMGFSEEEFEKRTEVLSGGEKTRLALARLILEEPDLLILDEPTNHLDLQATEWLERWIRSYRGAVLLVSHDRVFLENTAERVLELRHGEVFAYPGPFNKYLQLRAADQARQAEIAARQAAQIAKLDEFVRRFMNSQRTAQARGRQKLMNRLIEDQVQAPTAERGLQSGFGKVARSGDIVLAAERLKVGFQDAEPLIKSFDWTVRFGERWGVIGENGAGKSTLLKAMLGKLPLLSGAGKVGSNVSVGYFSQDAVDLDPDDTPLGYLTDTCGLLIPEARNRLGRFLLEGDDVFRPIGTLSGGEKNKLVLCRLVCQSPNLLVLDEPTNHLDMDSREALAEILSEYPGTLVLISHDRHLLSLVTKQILDVRSAGPQTFPGGFSEYRDWLQNRTDQAQKPKTKKAQAEAPKPEKPSLSPRELSKEIARVEKLISSLEDQVAAEEEALSKIEQVLAAPPEGSDLVKLSLSHSEQQAKIEELMKQWEAAGELLGELRSQQG